MSRRRHFGALAFIAALAARPLAAQEAPEDTAEPSEAVEPFALAVFGGDERTLAAYPAGSALPADRRVCLAPDQTLAVSANGETLGYAGPGCLEPRGELAIPAEVYAGSHVWVPLSEESPGWSQGEDCSAIVVASSGPSAEALPRGRVVRADDPAHRDPLVAQLVGELAQLEGEAAALIVLQAGDRVTLLGAGGTRTFSGPGTFRVPCDGDMPETRGFALTRGGERRARVGAVRSAPEMASAPSVQSLVAIRGTAGALAKFPRGTLVASADRVCLSAGERLTLAARSGARVTFAGPGCARKLDSSSDDNTAAVAPG